MKNALMITTYKKYEELIMESITYLVPAGSWTECGGRARAMALVKILFLNR